MFKVAIVGHSQVPRQLHAIDTTVRIFRAPGGRVSSFHSDSRLSSVLSWEHHLTFLWLGSNDVTPEVSTGELAGDIIRLATEIENKTNIYFGHI